MRRRSFLSTASASIAAICIRQELVRAASGKAIRIGLVADPQYADIDTWNTRFYRQSVGKLGEAIAHFNGLELDFCVNLGDLIDKHWQSYDAIFDPLSKSKHTFHHVLGNHDFDLLDEFKPRVPNRMGMPNRYYTWSLDPWVFAFLDTTDVSLYAQAIDKPEYAIANQQLTQLKATGAKNAQSWNSALSTRQIDWFEATCQSAALKNQRIIVFSHHPVFPENEHNTWNSKRILEVVAKHRNVVAWLNGHNHAGNFGIYQDVPFITLKGMVETKDTNAFATMQLMDDRMQLTGHGREPSREIVFRTITS